MGQSFDIVMPSENQEGTKSILGRWLKEVGQPVTQHEPLVEITTDKVTLEIAAPRSGVLTEVLKKPNEDVAPGEVLGRIGESAAKPHSAPPPKGSTSHESTPRHAQAAPLPSGQSGLSPAVKQFIAEHRIDIAAIQGSGAGGRITYDDVVKYNRSSRDLPKPSRSQTATSIAGRKTPHSAMRRMIADHMVESLLHTAPHVTSLFEVDLSKVIAHRAGMKGALESRGIRLTLTSYFIKAACHALCAVPEVNSRWHDDHLEVFEDCNIGVATALEQGTNREAGLIVPVIHGAQLLSLEEIAKKLQELTDKGRRNALQSPDVQGGTFTISNHGVSGSLLATPIVINQPQSAILGIGKLEKRVVVREVNGHDTMQILPMAYVTLTIDHRVLDGFTANRFLTVFTRTLEEGAF